ncbi:MAG: AmmeMemoRadiSam system protein A [Pirellulales bacterium]|nr:AmmeMemoRadiSam system protein A [Pirellulales bacterium]
MDNTATPADDDSTGSEDAQPGAVYTKADRDFLLDLARHTISDVVLKRKLPQPDSAFIPEKLRQRRACFVTLRLDGKLRGCIGSMLPENPLYKAVIHMANRAATHDTRFHPVSADEVDKLHIEISVLSEPKPLEFSSPEDLLDKLQVGIDGVVLKLGLQSATFLPQVWKQLTNKREFLSRLCEKARLAPGEWRNPKLKIETYQVEAFEEE